MHNAGTWDEATERRWDGWVTRRMTLVRGRTPNATINGATPTAQVQRCGSRYLTPGGLRAEAPRFERAAPHASADKPRRTPTTPDDEGRSELLAAKDGCSATPPRPGAAAVAARRRRREAPTTAVGRQLPP